MFDLKGCGKRILVFVRVLFIVVTFCIFSAWIFFLTEGKIVPKNQDGYFICFALSVFLGSASYSLCHYIAKMSEPLFSKLVDIVKNYLLVALSYTILFWTVAVLTSYDKNSIYYAIGICIYMGLLGFLYKVIRKFDSDVDELIAGREDDDIQELADALAKYLDGRYVMSGDRNKGKPEASQK